MPASTYGGVRRPPGRSAATRMRLAGPAGILAMDSPPPNIERLLQERAIAGWKGGTYDPHWPALAQCLDHSLTRARRSLGCCVAQLPIARFRGATQREAPSTDLPTPSRSS